MDTESTKTLLWKFPVSGNGKVNNTDKQGFEFSVRKAVIKTAFQIQAVWLESALFTICSINEIFVKIFV